MMRIARAELEAMRQEGLSSEVRAQFSESKRAIATWEGRRWKSGLSDALDWIDELRRLFGEPEVDLSTWRGDDFRL